MKKRDHAYLDEVYLKIDGRKLLKKYAFAPERLVTDDLRSYSAAAHQFQRGVLVALRLDQLQSRTSPSASTARQR